MTSVKELWLTGIGNAWFQHNKDDLGKNDVIIEIIEKLALQPECVLEIGCCNGWRLKKLEDQYKCQVYGIDPSQDAIKEAIISGLNPNKVVIGTADHIYHAGNNLFDIIILGYCLCFIPPEDWPNVISETSRVLRDGGHLIINDFAGPSRIFRFPFQQYTAIDGPKPLYIYCFDWPTMWLIHPGYYMIHETHIPDRAEVASVLKKDYSDIFAQQEIHK